MLCDECNQNDATLRLTTVINGQKSERNLCPACAAKMRAGLRIENMQSLLSALLKNAGALKSDDPALSSLRCSGCGTTYEQFKKTSRLGCAQCYQDFRAPLKPVLQRIHGRVQHAGRVPRNAGAALLARRALDRLRAEMEQAVATEDFERAAALRDEIRALSAKEEARQHA